MKTLMRLAKDKQTAGMLPICEDMTTKTKILLSLWDPGLVEEALNFVEEYKLLSTDDSGVGEDLSLDSNGRPSLILSPFKRITQHLTSLDLRSPDLLDDFATPCTPRNVEDIWRVNNSNQENKQHTSNLLNTSEGVKSLCTNLHTPDDANFVIFPDCDDSGDTNQNNEEPSSLMLPAKQLATAAVESDNIGRTFLDTQVMCSSPSANYYKPTDEPEPWDITQLNIEASVMCLVSKVKFLCGKCGSPAVRLRQKPLNRKMVITDQPSTLTNNNKDNEAVTKAVNSVTKVIRNGNKFTDGLDINKIVDWAAELRPSMRKLRQAMDGLLKTARLTHSVFRVQEDSKAAQRVCNVRYRRDVCFSQALTSLVAALMTRLWCYKPDPVFITCLSTLGPLAYFESLLSYYGSEIDLWGDMSVAVEDLSTVIFVLTRCPSPAATNDSYPLPKITGSRHSLTVSLPISDALYSLIPSKQSVSFKVTPVFFNIGINEKATLAETLGATKPQERSNVDNYERLNHYYLKYRKLNIPETNGYGVRTSMCSTQLKPVAELLNMLKISTQCGKPKNVEVLHLASQICRQMKGE